MRLQRGMTEKEQFIRKISPEPMSGCWLWEGNIERGGYGLFKYKCINRSAHRAAYRLFVGEIPDGLVLDHKCRTRCCVNPAHLEAVTQKENVRRSMPWHVCQKFKMQTHCKSGHELNQENTYVKPNGERNCRPCSRIRQKIRRAPRKASVVA